MQLSQLDIYSDSPVRRHKKGTETWLLFLFIAISSILAVAGPGGIARVFFMGGSAVLGFILCSRNPPLYVSFVFWLSFLTPFVRRLVDYRTGWVEPDPILAATLLAAFACLPKVCRSFLIGNSAGSMPFVLAISAASYGALVGIFFIPFSSLIIQAASWITPALFGLFVLFEYKDSNKRPALVNAFESTFKWGLFAMGLYSIIQFTMLPAWDALWVIEADNPAFGTPDPFSVRVFSTMASPVPLGVASFVGLILLMRQRGNASILATVAGYTSLALCTVRSAWGLWAIGTVLVLFREKEKLFRFLFVTLAAMFLLFLSTSFQPVRDVLQTRLETFSDLSDDGSFQARTSGYEEMVKYVLANPIGSGLGAMDIVLAGKSELGGRDSGILEIALSLGWVGGATYFFALALIVWNGLTGPVSRTPFEIAAVAISIAVISHMVLSTITGGFSGMALWSFAGISIAARLHPNEP